LLNVNFLNNDGVNKENQRKAILAVAKNRGIKVELTEITMSATKKISSRGINSGSKNGIQLTIVNYIPKLNLC
jgi:hypothetical protein